MEREQGLLTGTLHTGFVLYMVAIPNLFCLLLGAAAYFAWINPDGGPVWGCFFGGLGGWLLYGFWSDLIHLVRQFRLEGDTLTYTLVFSRRERRLTLSGDWQIRLWSWSRGKATAFYLIGEDGTRLFFDFAPGSGAFELFTELKARQEAGRQDEVGQGGAGVHSNSR